MNNIVLAIIVCVLACSCKKLLQVDPPIDKISKENLFTDSTSISAALVGIYSVMNATNGTPENQITRFCATQADELVCSETDEAFEFYSNSVTPVNSAINLVWINFYNYIYQANLLIENMEKATTVSTTAKNQFLGEALFIRSFSYFYLVNLFGEVPLVLTTDYRKNSTLARTSEGTIYDQVETDLLSAIELLKPEYITERKVRPNKWTAMALLARVYLYRNKYNDAEAAATEVINSGLYDSGEDVLNAFKYISRETIWQLYPVDPNYNTFDGNYFVPETNDIVPAYILPTPFITGFENNDMRTGAWIREQQLADTSYNYPFKYKERTGSSLDNATEYTIVFRLMEQYLIRAEARARQNTLPDAVDDLNVVRSRAGLPDVEHSLTQPEIIAAVEKERRYELFAEWGHRWFDLKRTGRATAVLGPVKTHWDEQNDLFWPLPQPQSLANPNL